MNNDTLYSVASNIANQLVPPKNEQTIDIVVIFAIVDFITSIVKLWQVCNNDLPTIQNVTFLSKVTMRLQAMKTLYKFNIDKFSSAALTEITLIQLGNTPTHILSTIMNEAKNSKIV